MKSISRRAKIVLLAGYLLAAGILVAGAVSGDPGGRPIGVEGGKSTALGSAAGIPVGIELEK